jgi:hypothetical protein
VKEEPLVCVLLFLNKETLLITENLGVVAWSAAMLTPRLLSDLNVWDKFLICWHCIVLNRLCPSWVLLVIAYLLSISFVLSFLIPTVVSLVSIILIVSASATTSSTLLDIVSATLVQTIWAVRAWLIIA